MVLSFDHPASQHIQRQLPRGTCNGSGTHSAIFTYRDFSLFSSAAHPCYLLLWLTPTLQFTEYGGDHVTESREFGWKPAWGIGGTPDPLLYSTLPIPPPLLCHNLRPEAYYWHVHKADPEKLTLGTQNSAERQMKYPHWTREADQKSTCWMVSTLAPFFPLHSENRLL